VKHRQELIEKRDAKRKRKEERQLKRQKLMEQREAKRLRILAARKERPDYSENIYMEFDCENLSNLYERSQKEL